MNCRRCNSPRNLGHYQNDLFDGWFCVACVDELIDADIARQMSRHPATPRTAEATP